MEKYPLAKKAYAVNFDKINEGYLSSGAHCYADNNKKARSMLLDELRHSGWELKGGEEITYINIPVVRSPHLDKFHFEGQELCQFQIEQILNERVRDNLLQEMLKDPNIKYCYIRKHGMYYRPNSCGYTDYKTKAGVYDTEDAVSHARGCRDINLEVIDIEKHNERITEEINDLKSRIISNQPPTINQ